MAQVDPIWKFCELLDRLVQNDSRIIRCITAITHDHPFYVQRLVLEFESRYNLLIDPFRKLLFLYVVDSLTYNIPIAKDLFQRSVSRMFDSAIRDADYNTKILLEKLLIVWEQQQRFKQEVLDDMRDRLEPPPPMITSPINDDSHESLFKLGEFSDLFNTHSTYPPSLSLQAIDDTYPSLFEELLIQERSRAELDQLISRLQFAGFQDSSKFLNELYDELPKQCLICGMRFSLESELDHHLDWHFQEKNRKTAPSPWLPDGEDWANPRYHLGLLQIEEQVETQEKEEIWCVCNPNHLFCKICGEPFELEARKGNWYCKDAAKVFVEDVQQEVTLHLDCAKAVDSNNKAPGIQMQPFQDSFVF